MDTEHVLYCIKCYLPLTPLTPLINLLLLLSFMFILLTLLTNLDSLSLYLHVHLSFIFTYVMYICVYVIQTALRFGLHI